MNKLSVGAIPAGELGRLLNMATQSKEEVSRRAFFGAAGKGAAIGLGTVVAAMSGAQAAEVEDPQGRQYRESDHVKTYYNSAKF